MFITVENAVERRGHTKQKDQCGPINSGRNKLSKTIRSRDQFQCGENAGCNPDAVCYNICYMLYWCWIVSLFGLWFAVHPFYTRKKDGYRWHTALFIINRFYFLSSSHGIIFCTSCLRMLILLIIPSKENRNDCSDQRKCV